MSSLVDLISVDSPDWNQIQELVRSDKDLLNRPINNNLYLLHYACGKKAPPEFVIQLINDYPQACEEKGTIGYHLPLHIACEHNQSISVIQLLITKYPKALKERDLCGYLPLHLACAKEKASLSVIQLLITNYPKACQEQENVGLLPLHAACYYNASLSVIQLLAQQWPDALTKNDCIKRKPLDCAREPFGTRIPNKETITWLEKITPDAINRSKIYFCLIKYLME